MEFFFHEIFILLLETCAAGPQKTRLDFFLQDSRDEAKLKFPASGPRAGLLGAAIKVSQVHKKASILAISNV